jgi:hypothetical protein
MGIVMMDCDYMVGSIETDSSLNKFQWDKSEFMGLDFIRDEMCGNLWLEESGAMGMKCWRRDLLEMNKFGIVEETAINIKAPEPRIPVVAPLRV